MCVDCARRLETTAEGEFTCQAYPVGIPDEIFDGEWDHRVPQPGDGGLQFVLRDGSEPREWWPDESKKKDERSEADIEG